jgi:ATP-dependent exoDNAse (exonuclease V) beta subunit
MLEKREQWLSWLLKILRGDFAPDDLVLRALAEIPLRELESCFDADLRKELVAILCEASGHSEKLAWAAGLKTWPACEPSHYETWRRLVAVITKKDGDLRQVLNVSSGFPPKLPTTARANDFLKKLNGHPQAIRIAEACRQLAAFPGVAFPEQLRADRLALARMLLRLTQHLKLAFGRRGEADFTEIALAANRALSGEHGYSDLLDRSDARIRHLLVDEMQDTSESQIGLLQLLTSGWTPGDGHSLFMVGDPQQSIYSFRNAEVRLFLQQWRDKAIGDVPLDCITLTTNFRSQPALIEWFNETFRRVFPAKEDRYAGVVTYNACVAGRTDAAGTNTLSVLPFRQDDPQGEADAVAAHAKRLWESHGEGTSIAVLGRTRAHLHRSIAALRRAGLPVSCQDIDPLHDLPAVREYVHLARALWHPGIAWPGRCCCAARSSECRTPISRPSHAASGLVGRGAAGRSESVMRSALRLHFRRKDGKDWADFRKY